MGRDADAVAIFRPSSKIGDAGVRSRLVSARGTRPHLRTLDDGAILWWTFARFPEPAREAETRAFRAFLAAIFGDDLPDMHDDPRGLFVYPVGQNPSGRTYQGIVREMGRVGRWVDIEAISPESEAQRREDMTLQVHAMKRVWQALEDTRALTPDGRVRDEAIAYALTTFDRSEIVRLDARARRQGEGSFCDQLRHALPRRTA